MKKVIALQDGFYGGARIRKGEKFRVHDEAKGRWFVDEADYKEPAPKPYFDAERQGVKRSAQSFVTLMKQLGNGEPVEEAAPSTLSEAAKGLIPKKHDLTHLGKK